MKLNPIDPTEVPYADGRRREASPYQINHAAIA
jgi:hypothetical protein